MIHAPLLLALALAAAPQEACPADGSWRGTVQDGDLGLLRDVGLGLRLSSSRSGQGAMVHLDLAFPLTLR